MARYDGKTGSFEIAATDKTGRDFRGEGRLQYVGKHHLRFAGSGRYFLKAGPDAPETLLAYADFDNTRQARPPTPHRVRAKPGKDLHRYDTHLRDWRPGDPTWKDGKGKGLIGALNYLAAKGCNAFSFLPYNAGGDGDNVWPFVERDGQAALRLLEARPVADRLRPRAATGTVPAFQAAGDRNRRQPQRARQGRRPGPRRRRRWTAATWASNGSCIAAS